MHTLAIRRLRSRYARPGPYGSRDREHGIAVLIVLACLAVLMPFSAAFNYQARVDFQSAVNLRDEIAARQIQRGGVALSLLLFEVQRRVFNNKQYVQMMGKTDITQVAPYLMAAFGTSDGASGLGDLVGIDTTALKELAIEGGSFEVRVEAESGKMNVNCLAAVPSGPDDRNNAAARTAQGLARLMQPVIFNPLFEEEKPDGRRYTREDIVRAMVDYVDDDRRRFDPVTMQSGSQQEDDRYEALYDNYQPRNARLDSVEELNLIRGIDDDWMLAFGSELTTYGSCKVNLNFASAEQIALVIQYAALPAERQYVEGDNFILRVLPLANLVVQYREMSLFTDLSSQSGDGKGGGTKQGFFGRKVGFKEFVDKPDQVIGPLMALTGGKNRSFLGGLGRIPTGISVTANGVPAKDGAEPVPGLSDVATVEAEKVYRVEIITEVGAVKKRVTAVYDIDYARSQSQGKGAWVYFRED